MAEKNTAGLDRLKNDIKQGTPAKCYVFTGQESYLRDYYFAALKKLIVPEGFEDFNYRRFEGAKLDFNELQSAMDALPMMAERTLVVIHDFEFFKAAEAVRDKVAALLYDLPDYCCLVFYYDTVEYKADGRMKKLADAVKRNVVVAEFAQRGQSEMLPWIRRAFRESGHDIDKSNSEYLMFLCGGLMTNLRSEIAKISACAKNTIVTKEDINAVATPVTEAVVFDMTDAVAKGEADRALKVLGDLFALKEEPIKLGSLIGSQMRGVQLAKLAAESGKTSIQLAEMLGYKSDYPARKLLDAAKRRSSEGWLKAVRLASEADIAMKRTGVDRQAILTTLVVALCERGAR